MLALVVQLCPTLCKPRDCSLPGVSVHGIVQARILERVAIPLSRESSQARVQTHASCISHIPGGFFPSKPPRKPQVGMELLYNSVCKYYLPVLQRRTPELTEVTGLVQGHITGKWQSQDSNPAHRPLPPISSVTPKLLLMETGSWRPRLGERRSLPGGCCRHV